VQTGEIVALRLRRYVGGWLVAVVELIERSIKSGIEISHDSRLPLPGDPPRRGGRPAPAVAAGVRRPGGDRASPPPRRWGAAPADEGAAPFGSRRATSPARPPGRLARSQRRPSPPDPVPGSGSLPAR